MVSFCCHMQCAWIMHMSQLWCAHMHVKITDLQMNIHVDVYNVRGFYCMEMQYCRIIQWLHRKSFSKLRNRNINSAVVVFWRCYFHNHDKTMLIGADPSHVGDRCIRVTIHHCFFDGTRQRHPRVRFGKVHLYNNYTRNWGIYAVCASVESQVASYSWS